MMENPEPVLELRFPVTGSTIPADHGYVIFSALCTLLPELRIEQERIQGLAVAPIAGRPVGGRRLALGPGSNLIFRLPASRIPGLLPLAGKTLPMPGNGALAVGVPETRAIVPCQSLYSRLVTIKVRGLKESAPDYHHAFLAAARRMATELGLAAEQLDLVPRRRGVPVEGKTGARADSPWLRRTLAIKHRKIAGYALLARGLDPAASIALQAHGLGGRRHFGCGVFVDYDRYLA